MELQLIRNATVKLCYGGITFLIDPYLGEKHSQPSLAGRSENPTVDLPFSIKQVMEGVDYIIVSHLHPDHFDDGARRNLSRQAPILCQPEDLAALKSSGFGNTRAIAQELDIQGVSITRTDCQHGSGEILPLMGVASGFVFRHLEEKTLYWCGDTVWYDGVQQVIDRHNPGIIVCHAGGNAFLRSYNVFGPAFSGDSESLVMDAEQVLTLCDYAPQAQVVATHIGALDHDSFTRQELRNKAATQAERGQLLVPEDGQGMIF
ncbi:MAG: MBL fold metallo-hydrolase [Imperialibacter sp.]|uniref:MBL fold metallo-hydrolase n=1 Tax=Imperialibacter sp. TaxID=2038411 RepID=UPI0032ED65C1